MQGSAGIRRSSGGGWCLLLLIVDHGVKLAMPKGSRLLHEYTLGCNYGSAVGLQQLQQCKLHLKSEGWLNCSVAAALLLTCAGLLYTICLVCACLIIW